MQTEIEYRLNDEWHPADTDFKAKKEPIKKRVHEVDRRKKDRRSGGVDRRAMTIVEKTILVLLLFVCFSTVCQAGEYNVNERINDKEYGSDYIFHYAAGAVIGGLTWYYLPDHWHPVAKWVTAVGVSVLTKTIIESFDEPFDSRDILDYGIGGAISVTILEISF